MSYVTKRSVPVLDEHTLTHEGEDGEEVQVKLDGRRLQEIADRNNKRIQETGDWTPIVIGHTKDDADEDEQPEIVGYAGEWKVEPFARTGRKALTATFKLFKHAVPRVRKYPRRSVELWLSDWKIDPIALLGATTPERDLGLLRLSRTGPRVTYSRDNDLMPLPPQNQNQIGASAAPQDDLATKIMAMLQESAVFKWAEQKMQEEQAMDQDPSMGMGGMDGMDMPPPPPPGMDGEDGDDVHIDIDSHDEEDDEEGYEDEDDEEDEDEEPVQYNASTASGSNTFPPGPTKTKKMSRTPNAHDVLDRIRMMADQRRSEMVRMSRALAKQQQLNADLRLRFQRAERERDLVQLEAEGFVFDRVEELDAVAGLPDPQYKLHLSRIRKRYQRAPIGRVSFGPSDLRSAGGSAERSRDKALQIANYAAEKGLTYEQASIELEGE